jgi:hypothetical protein
VAVVRFPSDADLNRAIVTSCRRAEPALDFLTAADAELKGKPDNEVLAVAADMGRILVTHDSERCRDTLVTSCSAAGITRAILDTPESAGIQSGGIASDRLGRIPSRGVGEPDRRNSAVISLTAL